MADPQRTIRFPEAPIDNALDEIANLEAALGVEIALLRSQAPGRPHGSIRGSKPALAGRPMWWWRAMLVAWTHAPGTRRVHSHDLLRGLSQALRDFEDGQLLSYLETIEADLEQTA